MEDARFFETRTATVTFTFTFWNYITW